MKQGALSDVTVLDMTRVLSGPFAATWLGEMGANVIKIEIPGGGDESRRNPHTGQGNDIAYDHGKEAVQTHAGSHAEGLVGQESHANHTYKGSNAGCHEDTVPQCAAGIEARQQVGVQSDDVSHGHKSGQTSHQLCFYIGSVFPELENFLKHR